MVFRIEVIPTEVRGYGNIIIPKTSSDFIGKYNDIYTNINGDFVLAYGGILLKITTTVSDSIKGLTANLNVIVTKRDDNTPIEDIIVGCKVDGTSLTNETTDENGECDFSWTPGEVGDSTILITIQQQDDYAGLTETKEITIGLLLSFNNIMNDLRLEDDELYVADISQQVESRTQLNPFVKDIWVAKGGEPIVDEYGIVHIAEKGDLIVEQDSLDQLSEYDNILFEGDVELLTGAVYDMELSEDYELIVNCLERDDIIGASGISLTASQTSVTYGSSVTLTATVIDEDTPVSGETVTFYDGETLLGSDTTDSDGVATLSTSSLSIGSHSCTAVYDESTSNVVTVTVSDVPAPTPASVSLTSDKSILSYADSESATLSATVKDSSSNPIEGVTVEFFKGSTSLGTVDTNSSGVATKSYASAGSGDVSFTAGVGSLVSEIYVLEDCIFYDSLTTDKSLFTLVQGTASMVYSNNGLKYTGTSNTDCIHKLIYDLPDGSYTLECDVTDISSSGYSTGIGTEDAQILKGNSGLYARYISKSGDFFNNGNASTPFHLTIEVTGTSSKTIKYYRDTTLLGTGSNVSRNKQFVFRSYNNRMMQIKDLKVKPL